MTFSKSGTTSTSYSTISSNIFQKKPESFQNSPEVYSSVSVCARKIDILVVVDAQVEDTEKLLKGVISGAEVILLDSTKDGVKQITHALREYTEISELQIISHGTQGCLQLGNTQLSLDTLDLYANELQNWSVDTLILYGCNVAAGDAGVEFIEKLHQFTGAKIAASLNKTGNAALGGDWNLDVKTDEFDVTLALSPEAIANYRHTLPLPIQNLVTEAQDAEESDTEASGIIYNFGQGSNLQVQSFEDEEDSRYLSAGVLNNFKLRRVDNPEGVQGLRQIVWYQEDESSATDPDSTTINLIPEQAQSDDGRTPMQTALFSEFINRGTDNIFANVDNPDGNINNIERVDYISTDGLSLPQDSEDLDGIGFLILERGGNDPFKIAAITAVDDQGNPTAYGDLLSFANPADPNDVDWGLSDTEFRVRVLRQEEGDGDISNTRVPQQINSDPQNIAGIFVSYEDLLAGNPDLQDSQFFGYSLFPPDIDGTNDLVELSDFPPDTSDREGPENERGGLDLVGGGVVYRREDINFPPEAGDDTAITDPDTPVEISVLENDRDDRDDVPGQPVEDPISIVGITTPPANGIATVDDRGTPDDPTDDVIVYTPNFGFNGAEDSFVYQITDGEDTTTATVTVTVTSTIVGGTVFTDTDGDDNLDPNEPRLGNITVNLVDDQGNPVGTPAETSADGVYQFEGFAPGEYTVEVDTTDEDLPTGVTLGTDSVPVTVAANQPVTEVNFGFDPAPVNQPPIAQNVESSSIPNNSNSIALPLSTNNFSDPDGIVETIRLTLPNPAQGVLLFDGVEVSDPTQVQLLTPNQLDNLSFRPNPTYQGDASFTYQVTDDDGAVSDIANITIPVAAAGGGTPSNSTVSGTVFTDNDNNNTLSPDEPGIENITVNLVNTNGTVVDSVDTNADGVYQFESVASGDYTVEIDTTDTDIPADFTLGTLNNVSVPVDANQSVTDVNFGFDSPPIPIPTTTVSGTVFTDTDNNNTLGPDEPGIENITVNLVNTNGNILASVPTNADGGYQFEGVAPGNYTVVVDTTDTDLPTDVTLGTSSDVEINVEANQPFDGVNFGFDSTPTPVNQPPIAQNVESSSIPNNSNSIALPLSTDNFSDPDGIVETIRLTLPNPAQGVLLFDGVEVTDPSQVQQLTPNQLDNLSFRPNPTYEGNASLTYQVTDNDGATSDLASITIPVAAAAGGGTPSNSTVSGTVFTDNDNNDTLDPSEPGIEDITVNLVDQNGTVVDTAETSVDGVYQFESVASGDYTVEIDTTDTDIPADFTLGTPNNVPVTVVANQSVPDQNFGFDSTSSNTNVPPTATNQNVNTTFETTASFDLTDNVSDPDGTVDLTTIDLDPTTPEIDQQVTLPQGTFTVNNQGQVTFAPAGNFSGTVTVPYTIQDNLGATSELADISVTVSPDSNQPPSAEDVESSSILNNSNPIPLPVSTANFSDSDGTVELINFTLPDPAQGILLLDGVAVTNPIQVQRLTPNQLDNLTFQPGSGFSGNASFSYTVTDDDGANSNIANITVPVIAVSVPTNPGGGNGGPSGPPVNLPPEAENETANIPNDGTRFPIPPLRATDLDGSINFYTITQLPPNGTLLINGEEVTNLDQVQQLTPEQAGQLTFEPDPNLTSDVSFTYTATDNEGTVSNVATVSLVVDDDSSIPRGEPIDDGGCNCPPLPEFGVIPLPEPSGLIPTAFNAFGSIDGTPQSDTISGSLGSDMVFAFGGDDHIEASEGPDTVFGGDGNDLSFGEEGNDSLLGDRGSDTLIGSNGSQDIAATATIDENDFIYGHASNDLMQGGPGADMMYSGKQDDFAYGGQNDDMVWGDLGSDTLYGDQGNDTMIGDTADENEVEAERGLSGMIDFMWGGAGDDLMNGGRSNDTLSGGVGNDTVRGGKEDDLVYGEAGDDLMYGDLGNDLLCGNEGNDTIYGDINDNETISTLPGRDTLCGGSGNDILFGNEDQDRLCGGEDSDTLYGGDSEDTLAGEQGDDWLFGDQGNDLISGGSGIDRFILFSGSGTDTIQDFQLGTDLIALGGGLTFDALTLSQSGTSTILSLDTQQLAILNDIQVSALTETSFTAFVG